MSLLFSRLRNVLKKTPLAARNFLSTSSPCFLPPETAVEEEKLPYYSPGDYYPVNIGDVFKSRYQVVGKLGYGAYSTVWLCRDLSHREYKAVKVSTSLRKFPEASARELKIYEHLSRVQSKHPGHSLIRELYDSFEIDSPDGKHYCLAQQPMHMSLLDMMSLNPDPFSVPLLKTTLRRLLSALDFLHTDAHVIHTDLKCDNLMLSIEDMTMLQDFEKAELQSPSPRKHVSKDRTIYLSRRLRKPKDKNYGLPILCDFGEARIGLAQESGRFIQPHIYRAPEVIFEMQWGSAVDIWNVACLIWDFFEGQHLFRDIFDENRKHDPFKHLASMVSLIGSPPSEFVKRSETTDQCFDLNGKWMAAEHANVVDVSLEAVETRLVGEEKIHFLRFIRSMLRWLPEERKTAKELLEDPWLIEEHSG